MLILPPGWTMNTAGEIRRIKRSPKSRETCQPSESLFDTGLTIIKDDGTRRKIKKRVVTL